MATDLADAATFGRSVGGEALAEAALALDVLYEDTELLAVAKVAGMVTHPAYKHPDGTLADAVFARQAERGEGRPWLLHRLDRETSGVVLFAKTEGARRALVRQFERRTIRKLYLAITDGVPVPEDGTVEAALRRDPLDRRRVIVDAEGQAAATRYWTLRMSGGYALVLAQPLSGRTHQIRVHLAARGAAILGDGTYARGEVSAEAARTLLHAWRLEIAYPGSGAAFAVEAPLPADFAEVAARLGLGDALAQVADEAARGIMPPQGSFIQEFSQDFSSHEAARTEIIDQ